MRNAPLLVEIEYCTVQYKRIWRAYESVIVSEEYCNFEVCYNCIADLNSDLRVGSITQSESIGWTNSHKLRFLRRRQNYCMGSLQDYFWRTIFLQLHRTQDLLLQPEALIVHLTHARSFAQTGHLADKAKIRLRHKSARLTCPCKLTRPGTTAQDSSSVLK